MGMLEQMAGVPDESTQTTTDVETQQITHEAEPEKTTHADEPDKTTEAVSEDEQTTQEPDPSDPDGTKKALKDTKAALTKLQQENSARTKAEADKAKTDAITKLETEQAKSSEEEKQANQVYQQKINQLKQGKAQLIAQETHRLEQMGYNAAQKAEMLAQFNYQLDSEYDSIKEQYESEKKTVIGKIQEQQKNIYSQKVQQNHEKAEEMLGDRLKNPVIKEAWEEIKQKGYAVPQDIVENIFPAFEKAIEKHKEALSKEFAANKARDDIKNKEPKLGGSHPREVSSDGGYAAFEKLFAKKKR